MKPAERRQHRVDHGLCPQCGKEAAPYYLCPDCRSLGSMTRLLNKMAREGLAVKAKQGRCNVFSPGPRIDAEDRFEKWGKFVWDMKPDDKRLKPRLGRRPVDLDETLLSIFTDAGKPLSIEEVCAAWGRLRTRRKTASLAGDMTAIIKAQRRREERAAKRATPSLNAEIAGMNQGEGL
jgi:hypothetical protein